MSLGLAGYQVRYFSLHFKPAFHYLRQATDVIHFFMSYYFFDNMTIKMTGSN